MFRALLDHTHQVISSTQRIQSLITDAETGHRGYLITGDSAYLEPYNDALMEIDGELVTLRALVADNPEQRESRQNLEKLDVDCKITFRSGRKTWGSAN
jgi:CHASE3 domain sensor protein